MQQHMLGVVELVIIFFVEKFVMSLVVKEF